jgi:hypothetical protein
VVAVFFPGGLVEVGARLRSWWKRHVAARDEAVSFRDYQPGDEIELTLIE